MFDAEFFLSIYMQGLVTLAIIIVITFLFLTKVIVIDAQSLEIDLDDLVKAKNMVENIGADFKEKLGLKKV